MAFTGPAAVPILVNSGEATSLELCLNFLPPETLRRGSANGDRMEH